MTGRDTLEVTDRQRTGEHNHTLLCAAIVYGAGVWLAPRVDAGWWPLWLLPVSALLWLALWLAKKPCRYGCLPLILMVALLWTQAWLNPQMPEAGSYAEITATVYGAPVERSGGRITVTLCDVTLEGSAQPGKAYCTLYTSNGVSADQLFDGASVRMEGTVYRPAGKQNEYDFDFRLWLLQQGIRFGVSGVKNLEVLNTSDTAPWKDSASRIRALCAERLQRIMGAESGLAMAMLLGDRDAMADEEQLSFQRAGVAHLMSVSGLHVALLAGVLAWVLGALSIRKAFRLPLMIALVMLYSMLTGFSPAAVRAAVMIALVLLAKAVGRKPDPLTTLATAAILILVLNPLQLFSAGFVLSFSAMVGITLLYPVLLAVLQRRSLSKAERPKPKGICRRLQRLLGNPLEVLAVSLAAQIGVLLPTAAYFHRLPTYGILFNLIAVPLAGLLLPLYAVTLLLTLLPWVGDAAAYLPGLAAQWGSKGLLWLIGLSNQLPYAQVRVPSPNVWAYAALLTAMLSVSRYSRGSAGKRALAIGLALVIGCAGAWAMRPASLRYHQLAVGQGDAALLVDGNQTVAIDVGEYGEETAARLLAEGRDLDALILTHLHNDHALGLQALLTEGITIRHVYLPESVDILAGDTESDAILKLIDQTCAPVTLLAAGDTLSFGHLRIDVLWPQAGRTREGIEVNDRSLAMLIHLGDLRILNPADNSSLYEMYFVKPCDVLKAAHHGSGSSTSEAFLAEADPRLTLITCRSGAALPAEETLSRLSKMGTRVFRTDETGEIILEARDGSYRARTYQARLDHEP